MPGKRIQVDDDTLTKLTDLGRHRMATFQELVDEAFADLLKKHGVPTNLKDALKKSAEQSGAKVEKPFPRKRGVNKQRLLELAEQHTGARVALKPRANPEAKAWRPPAQSRPPVSGRKPPCWRPLQT